MPGTMRLLLLVVLAGFCSCVWARGSTLEGVTLVHRGSTTLVRFRLSQAPHFDEFALGSPPRAVLDMHDTRQRWHARHTAGGAVKDVRLARHANGTLRAVVDLRQGAQFKGVQRRGANTLVMRIAGGGAGASETSSASPRPVPVSDSASGTRPAGFHAVPQSGPIVVVIDPGHGGSDPGTRGPHGLREKTVTLAIAKALYRKLARTPHIRPVLTRRRDRYVSLPRRVAIAQRHHANLFISIHENSYPRDPRVDGGTCYVLSQHGASDAKAAQLAHMENSADPQVAGVHFSRHNRTLNAVLTDLFQTASINAADNLARGIIAQFARVEPIYDHKVQRANFAVLRDPMIPSVLCETAFLSNPHQARRLHHGHFRDQLAQAIYEGVIHYLHTYAPMRIEPTHPGHYVVQRGDTLSSVASEHETSVKQLVKMNHMHHRRVRVGERLKVPQRDVASGGGRHHNPAAHETAYVVKHGDTLSGIALRHHVSVHRLMAMNGLHRKRLLAGDVLKVPAPPHSHSRSVTRTRRYTVRRGDTLSGIAVHHHTTVKRLEAINDLHGARLRVGQHLDVPVAGKSTRRYVVHRGDTLSQIAAAHGLSTQQVEAVNGLQGAAIRPGEVLRLPVDDNNSS